jgi:hypothetical protein
VPTVAGPRGVANITEFSPVNRLQSLFTSCDQGRPPGAFAGIPAGDE